MRKTQKVFGEENLTINPANRFFVFFSRENCTTVHSMSFRYENFVTSSIITSTTVQGVVCFHRFVISLIKKVNAGIRNQGLFEFSKYIYF